MINGFKVKVIMIISLVNFFSYSSFAQELVSAKELLQSMSANFKKNVSDYQASIKWIQGDTTQSGTLKFKNPQKMRIDFTDGQIICSDGYELWIFIANQNLLLKQELQVKEKKTGDDGKLKIVDTPLMTNFVGLDRLISEYAVEYTGTKKAETYKDGKIVYNFKLARWKTPRSGISVINLTVQEDGFIRKVEAFTTTFRKIVMEFDDIKANVGFNNLIFTYENPGLVNTINNFMSSGE